MGPVSTLKSLEKTGYKTPNLKTGYWRFLVIADEPGAAFAERNYPRSTWIWSRTLQRRSMFRPLDLSPLAGRRLYELNGRSLAMFICAHSAMLASDHLGELCRNQFRDSEGAKHLQLHRSKCSALIKNVLSPHFVDELLSHLGSESYSLILDESTDISVTKLLGVVIVYYSEKAGKVVSTFQSFVELTDSKAQSIVDAVKMCLAQFGIDLQRMVGIGTDNASVMIGVNNGVYQKLKADVPNLLLLLSDLTLLTEGQTKKLVLPTCQVDPLSASVDAYVDPRANLGYEVERTLQDLRKTGFSEESERVFRERCIAFLYHLVRQLQQRLPDNVRTLRQVSLLSVGNALCAVKESLVPLMEFMKLPQEKIAAIELQWDKLTPLLVAAFVAATMAVPNSCKLAEDVQKSSIDA
ncbi:hypothetical protein HPB47_004474 [Ixodes persulcatus]|uniref:Uncharacterized protein n=1 Tax=Ixodes persulcatus TaxID=34615 RepID=A0AC60PGP4_IXOPE|nr:hypothetical protein HPB47_004474 [Ixodes persulcatus]